MGDCSIDHVQTTYKPHTTKRGWYLHVSHNDRWYLVESKELFGTPYRQQHHTTILTHLAARSLSAVDWAVRLCYFGYKRFLERVRNVHLSSSKNTHIIPFMLLLPNIVLLLDQRYLVDSSLDYGTSSVSCTGL